MNDHTLAGSKPEVGGTERRSQEACEYEQVFGPFDRGEFGELSEQDWQALLDGKRTSEHDPQSWALPPKAKDR